MKPRRAILIVNPVAGRKGGILLNAAGPEDAHAALARHGIEAELCVTERAGHATVCAQRALVEGADLVVAAGGDGTIREVAAALVNTETPLAILPLGSMMNLARALGIPRDLDGAAALIREGRLIRMDVGRASTAANETYFLEAAGVGLDAGVFAYSHQLDSGRWRYLLPLFRFLRGYRATLAHLNVDGRLIVVPRALMVSVAVAPYIGLALALAPDARVDDRQFDVVARQAARRSDMARHLGAVALGLRGLDASETFRGRQIAIDSPGRPIAVHADAVLIGRTPARFELLPAALPVVTGLAAAAEPASVSSATAR